MSRTAQDLFHRRLHKCWDCATLVDLEHLYCPRCAALQARRALLVAALARNGLASPALLNPMD